MKTTSEQQIAKVMKSFPEGVTVQELMNLLDKPLGTVSGRLCELSKRGVVERIGNSTYRLRNSAKAISAKKPEMVVTGCTEIEFTFSNGETATISVASSDVITVSLQK